MSEAPAPKPPTKTELLNNVAAATGLSKKEVTDVMDAIEAEMRKSLAAEGPGSFTLPGLIKIERKHVPAKEARIGAPDPFRPGQTRDFPAKPATTKVKLRALKTLKEMVL